MTSTLVHLCQSGSIAGNRGVAAEMSIENSTANSKECFIHFKPLKCAEEYMASQK